MNLVNTESLPTELKEKIIIREIIAEQRLFKMGDIAEYLYIVKTGRIKIFRSTIENKSAVLQAIEPGEFLGENAIFGGRYTCNASAEIDSTLIAYPQELLISIIKTDSELFEDLTKKLVSKIETLKKNLELRSIKKCHLRLLQYLRYLAASSPDRIINLERSFKTISAELDVTPESVSRALVKLEREGTIARQNNLIILI